MVHIDPPATRPRFHNIEPRSREERLAIRDKDTLEKLRLEHRLKSNVKQDLNTNLLEPPPNSAGFISEADRFCTDAAGEEYAERHRKKLEREVRGLRPHRQASLDVNVAARFRSFFPLPSRASGSIGSLDFFIARTARRSRVEAHESNAPLPDALSPRTARGLFAPQEFIERKRLRNHERETARWDRVAMEEKFEDIKLRELKESEIPALNRSSVKYNTITLAYEDSYDGAALKYRDDVMRRNMAVAANRGLRHMKSSVDYDPITGIPARSAVVVPDAPVPPGPRPEKRDPREGMEAFRVDSLYGTSAENHSGVGRQQAY